MLRKGEISFIFLWVLNPIVILFYQNCSTARPVHAKALTPTPPAIESKATLASEAERSPASCAFAIPGKACAE